MENLSVPTFDLFMNPILQALRELGGSGTNEEINSKVTEIMGLSDSQLEVIHNPDRSSQTEVEYRLHWARTFLKKYGLIDNSSRGVWSLTAKGKEIGQVDPMAVKRFVRAQQHAQRESEAEDDPEEEPGEEVSWKEELLKELLRMDPSAFERLVQRVLRESGFIQVEVTGRSGDGGIDGKGIIRMGGLLSFHVIFQCKRYSGSVTPNQLRDFRGAMVGRADKGLLVTTGSFTKDAIREATRDGAPAIDLIDGDQLVEKLKELSLGVRTEKIEIERITIDRDWFAAI
jgi:restriction system protein